MTIIDELTERRLLTALICEPAALAAADDVETSDFTDPHHVAVFIAIRGLRAEGADVGVLEIDDWMRLRDSKRPDSFMRERCGAAFLGEIIVESAPYGHAVLWEHDMRWLRMLRKRREALGNAA